MEPIWTSNRLRQKRPDSGSETLEKNNSAKQIFAVATLINTLSVFTSNEDDNLVDIKGSPGYQIVQGNDAIHLTESDYIGTTASNSRNSVNWPAAIGPYNNNSPTIIQTPEARFLIFSWGWINPRAEAVLSWYPQPFLKLQALSKLGALNNWEILKPVW